MSTAILVDPISGHPLPLMNALAGGTVRARLGAQVQCPTNVGAVVVTVPLNPSEGSVFAVDDSGNNAATHNITVSNAGAGGVLIDGAASLVIAQTGVAVFFFFDRGQWRHLATRRRIDGQGNQLALVADGPAGPAGPAGPPGPGNVFSGVGGGNLGTISATEVATNATADTKTVLDSKIGHVAIGAGGPPAVTNLFAAVANKLYALDVIATAVNIDGTEHGRFNVRALVNVAAGVAVLLSGGSDAQPDATNTPGLDFTVGVDGALNITCTATGLADAVTFGWEARAQIQEL